LAAISLVLGVIVLRPLIAEALCMRGDEFLRSGEPLTAEHYYRLAIASYPDCRTAAERVIFASLEIRTRAILAIGIRVADAYLSRHDDTAIRIDRALALWATKDLTRAAKELSLIGAITHDRRLTRLSQIAMVRAKGIRR